MIDLYKGDCLQVMDDLIAKGIIVDAIITDPPYGTTACKWDTVIPFEEMWKRLNKLIKPNGAIVLFGSEPFSSALRMSNIKKYKYDWKWNKKQGGNPLNAKRQPLRTYEDIMLFNKHNYYPQMRKGALRKKGGINKQPEHTGKVNLNYSTVNDDYYPTAILEFSNADKANKIHPTQKPVALMKYLIKTYTNKGETILDFTMGSGTTGVAVEELNRDEDLDLSFIGIENDDKYFDIAKNRIEDIKRK